MTYILLGEINFINVQMYIN